MAYQGYRSWNAWNVSLWIGNDEGLYNLAKDCLRNSKGLGKSRIRSATNQFLALVGEGSKTPDGATYNFTCVQEALKGWDE